MAKRRKPIQVVYFKHYPALQASVNTSLSKINTALDPVNFPSPIVIKEMSLLLSSTLNELINHDDPEVFVSAYGSMSDWILKYTDSKNPAGFTKGPLLDLVSSKLYFSPPLFVIARAMLGIGSPTHLELDQAAKSLPNTKTREFFKRLFVPGYEIDCDLSELSETKRIKIGLDKNFEEGYGEGPVFSLPETSVYLPYKGEIPEDKEGDKDDDGADDGDGKGDDAGGGKDDDKDDDGAGDGKGDDAGDDKDDGKGDGKDDDAGDGK